MRPRCPSPVGGRERNLRHHGESQNRILATRNTFNCPSSKTCIKRWNYKESQRNLFDSVFSIKGVCKESVQVWKSGDVKLIERFVDSLASFVIIRHGSSGAARPSTSWRSGTRWSSTTSPRRATSPPRYEPQQSRAKNHRLKPSVWLWYFWQTTLQTKSLFFHLWVGWFPHACNHRFFRPTCWSVSNPTDQTWCPKSFQYFKAKQKPAFKLTKHIEALSLWFWVLHYYPGKPLTQHEHSQSQQLRIIQGTVFAAATKGGWRWGIPGNVPTWIPDQWPPLENLCPERSQVQCN